VVEIQPLAIGARLAINAMLEAVPTQSLPWSWYVDETVLRAEQERIFRRAWQYAGHLGQVAEPRSYFTGRAGLLPIVVTRDRDGALAAFVNVCRHRGFQVAQGEGRRASLQCGYHAWTYGLDGRLRAAPRADREPGFEPEELSLVPAQVDTWGPFVFVNPDGEAPPLAETLGELPELVASAGLDVEAIRHHHRAESELDANWKIVCENYLECYHCAAAHPSFSAMVDVAPDAYRLEASGAVSTQLGPLRENGKNAYDPEGEVERGQFQFVWPNLTINILPGRPNLSLGPVDPVTPARTARFLDYFFAADADPAWIEDLVAFDAQVTAEDRALVEGVQRGVSSGALEHGRLMSDAERLIVRFQQQVAEAVRPAAVEA
jgi:phenylpropionate dioxygenase-like ring-hydroxylating dioxygenase large terminal subunit